MKSCFIIIFLRTPQKEEKIIDWFEKETTYIEID